jgi:hypothetical protein
MATTLASCRLGFSFKRRLSIAANEKHLQNERIWIFLNNFMLISGWMDFSREVIAST